MQNVASITHQKTFFLSLLLYYLAYKSWKKAGATDKQKEKKE